MSPPTYLKVLLAGSERTQRARHIEDLPGQAGTTADWPDWVVPRLVTGLAELGMERPWRHQVEAAQALHAGQHAVLATPAGSGKSLGLWLDPLDAIARASTPGTRHRISAHAQRPTALYLAPTKALAADQLSSLQRLLGASGLTGVRALTCDGDSDWIERSAAVAQADIILTNPDYLHYAMLANHARWSRFWRALRTVVVDEAHAYRGIFGAHVALVLRRTRRIGQHYGATPVLAAASATLAQPAQLAARLFGVLPTEITCIDQSTAPLGQRQVVLWQPPVLDSGPPDGGAAVGEVPQLEFQSSLDCVVETDPELGANSKEPLEDIAESGEEGVPPTGPPLRRSAAAEAAELLADLTQSGARSLAFVRSRFAAEAVADAIRNRLSPSLASRVATYRAGYLTEERRQLEERLRTGSLTTVVTTSALELGIDIAGLDCVVIVGWPGTRTSLWQQIGRAGRAGAHGLAIWLAGTNPLDTYIVNHPEAIFGASLETSVFDPFNPHVLAPHLCAAAAELPLTAADAALFGSGMQAILEQLQTAGVLKQRSRGWYWLPLEPATSLTDLRGSGQAPIQIVQASTGQLLGTVDGGRAEATVHPGAVYVHQGSTFLVRELDQEAAIALVDTAQPRFRTRANSVTAISLLTALTKADDAHATWYYGQVEVREQVTSFTRLGLPGLARLDTVPLNLPERTWQTMACWWTVTAATLKQAAIKQSELAGALHALEHTAIGLLPLLVTCDRWDLGGLSTALHVDTEAPTIFIHDALAGGAGFAERAYAVRHQLMQAVAELLAACPCAEGCPSCVQSPKCGNANQMLNKAAATRLAGVLAGDAGQAGAADAVVRTN